MNHHLSLSPEGLALIAAFEGFRGSSYQDSAGVWTIGYGHTCHVSEGMACSREEADEWLAGDVHFASNVIWNKVLVPLTQGQFDALCSFTFNLGPGALIESTLLKKLHRGDVRGAAAEFERWCHAGGKRLEQLYVRRLAERAMFQGLLMPSTPMWDVMVRQDWPALLVLLKQVIRD